MKSFKDFNNDDIDQDQPNLRLGDPAFGICVALGIILGTVLVAITLIVIYGLAHANQIGSAL